MYLSFLWAFFLRSFFHLEPTLILHIFWIFQEIKASSSASKSSSDSSSNESSSLRALDELLNTYSLDDDAFLFFWLLRAKDSSLLGPSSCWSSCSWTLKVPTSSLRNIELRFFNALSAITYGLHFLDRLLKILSMWS